MILKAVIFDQDGVLVDTEYLKTDSVNATILHFGGTKTYTYEEKHQYAGMRAKDLFKVISEENNLTIAFEEYREYQLKAFFELLKSSPPVPIDGIVQLIKALKENGIKVGVGTGSTRESSNTALEYCGLSDLFEVVVCADDVDNGKPAPDTFLLVAERLVVMPEECVVVGDSHNDRIGAKIAGMKFVFYRPKLQARLGRIYEDERVDTYNNHKGEYPDEHLPDIVTESFIDLRIEQLQAL